MRVALIVVLVLAALAVVLPAGAIALNRVPLTQPPGIAARLVLYLGSNVAQTGPDAQRAELRPILLAGERAALLQAIAAACRGLGWRNVRIDDTAASVRAEVVTPWLHFTDDVRARLLPAADGLLEVRVRSASRVGRGDLGANTRHVMELRAALSHAGVLAGPRR
jgi:uncharacterized protein (DUF1499 family)